MTRAEILAMEPGRELDALVAEKVMNLCVLDNVQGYGDGCAMSDKGFDEWMKHPMFGKMEDPDLLEPYSTDISAAWEVADKLKIAIIPQSVAAPDELRYLAEYYGDHPNDDVRIFAPTAPEAICKAALIAVMEAES